MVTESPANVLRPITGRSRTGAIGKFTGPRVPAGRAVLAGRGQYPPGVGWTGCFADAAGGRATADFALTPPARARPASGAAGYPLPAEVPVPDSVHKPQSR